MLGGADLTAGSTSKRGDGKGSNTPAWDGAGGVDPETNAGSASAVGKAPVLHPTPSTGMQRPDDAPEPKLDIDTRDDSWYGRNRPTDQVKHAYSTQ